MNYFYVLFLLVFFFSCVNRNLKDYQPQVVKNTEEVPEELVSYTADIKPLIESRCSKCHKGEEGFDWTVLSDLQGVASTKYTSTDVDSKLLSRLKNTKYGTRMPQDGPPYLSDEQIGMIEKWANAGAPNN